MKIIYIAVHNSGGVANDQLASSAHLTAEKISRYHKQRWNFPSKYITDERYRYAGYNAIIERDGNLVWCRAIGEETAAQRGHNFDTFSVCIIGNFNRQGWPNPVSVDTVTEAQHTTHKRLLTALAEHRLKDVNAVVVPGTQYRFSAARIHPHRFYQATQCYGTSLSNTWAQGIVLDHYAKKYGFSRNIVHIFVSILDRLRIKYPSVGGVDDRSCEGFIG